MLCSRQLCTRQHSSQKKRKEQEKLCFSAIITGASRGGSLEIVVNRPLSLQCTSAVSASLLNQVTHGPHIAFEGTLTRYGLAGSRANSPTNGTHTPHALFLSQSALAHCIQLIIKAASALQMAFHPGQPSTILGFSSD